MAKAGEKGSQKVSIVTRRRRRGTSLERLQTLRLCRDYSDLGNKSPGTPGRQPPAGLGPIAPRMTLQVAGVS